MAQTKSLDRVTRYAKLANVADANALMVSVLYDKGGINYFNYQTDPRGYYVALRPVTVSDGPFGQSVSFPMFGSKDTAFKVLLKKVDRLNGKGFKDLALKVLPLIPQLAEAFDAGEPGKAHDLLSALKEVA